MHDFLSKLRKRNKTRDQVDEESDEGSLTNNVNPSHFPGGFHSGPRLYSQNQRNSLQPNSLTLPGPPLEDGGRVALPVPTTGSLGWTNERQRQRFGQGFPPAAGFDAGAPAGPFQGTDSDTDTPSVQNSVHIFQHVNYDPESHHPQYGRDTIHLGHHHHHHHHSHQTMNPDGTFPGVPKVHPHHNDSEWHARQSLGSVQSYINFGKPKFPCPTFCLLIVVCLLAVLVYIAVPIIIFVLYDSLTIKQMAKKFYKDAIGIGDPAQNQF